MNLQLVEERAEKEHGDEDQQSAKPVEHEHAMNGAYKSFRIGGQKKTDVESYSSREAAGCEAC